MFLIETITPQTIEAFVSLFTNIDSDLKSLFFSYAKIHCGIATSVDHMQWYLSVVQIYGSFTS